MFTSSSNNAAFNANMSTCSIITTNSIMRINKLRTLELALLRDVLRPLPEAPHAWYPTTVSAVVDRVAASSGRVMVQV